MKNTGTLHVTTRGDREIIMTRVFSAPRALVFEAMVTPELVKRWFGPHGHSLVVCEIDFKIGGKYRYVVRDPGGRDMGISGVYREINAPDRVVFTEAFDDFPGEAVITTELKEHDGKTTMTVTSLAPSKEARDAIIQSGMEHGAAETYDRLAALLAK